MKKFLFSFLALLMLSSATAMANRKTTLTVNGEQVEGVVASIGFDGDKAVISFADQTTLIADMEEVSLMFADDTTTGVLKQPVAEQLDIEGLTPGTEVTIYDAAGHTVATVKADKTSAMISAAGLKSGIYLLKAGNRIVKFIKR